MIDWHSQIRSFEIYLRLEKSLSNHTVNAYLHDVALMATFFKKKDLAPDQVKLANMQDLLVELNHCEIATSSQQRIISGIRAFYKYLQIEDLVIQNPTDLLSMPRSQRLLPDVLCDEEVDLLIDKIDKSTQDGMRNAVIVEVLYGCGLRVSELCQMRISDIFFEEEYIRVLGKGGKQRLIPIHKRALSLIQLYMAEVRNNLPIHPKHRDVLFLNRFGTSLSRVTVFTFVKEAARKAGINKNISPHSFRHSFATELVQNGADLRAVQEMLGHSSITTTEIYTHLNTVFLRKTIEEYHPHYRGK